jgi:hypothetical protein
MRGLKRLPAKEKKEKTREPPSEGEGGAPSRMQEKRDFSLRRPTASQEVKREEKAPACSVRNDRCGRVRLTSRRR